ncbi:pyruvate carboxylase [Conexibacter arvalis]|uniref:Pyruvate carboxylase n=1 Tax=Conexibacter arvalis TaxID=912552 RepID=A0A840IBA7_9ACTN|nr:pyruvate carboxylase [Conexibacter arvalis]MBB4661358.1 pyruvate carboxylase [Conexibacter arvalis]
MIKKVLVANRGEIAIRAFRAANELRIRSVALYAPEDRDSVHRLKADEAYEVGTPGHPVSTYLDPDVAVELALRVGADAIYPGYGFMSENPELARRCAAAGIVFVGPPPEVLGLAGNKTRARDAAIAAGVPVLQASEPVANGAEAMEAAEQIGFPVFVKASHGGGGRGMRLVTDPAKLAAAVTEARAEAEAAFGDGTVYIEQALIRPRHIEVQLLADATGDVVHLYERDCSLQRRHQKVIEITPAPNLDPELRDRICADAVKFARHVGYVNAGTVEFLLDPADGRYAFIEMNPRIQVEHTVTEETTDVDLVRAQLRVAGGATLADLRLSQETIRQRGVALQCRVTTEDPANGFRPDSGRITAYRSPGGAGVRLDEGSAFVGAEISPFFDPLLVKISARGRDLQSAVSRARRAVAELRVRGVKTNQGFLLALLDDPDVLAGDTHTTFVDERPDLSAAGPGQDRASRLLGRLAEVTVNHEPATAQLSGDPRGKLPPLSAGDPPAGSRQRLLELGPAAFAQALRAQTAVAVTDTTLRDAHQSLFATRMRTHDMRAVAPHLARELPGLLSMEVWGGATFDVALRFLHEDPWERLAELRELVPNVCLQMLLRGQNLLAYSRFPTKVVKAFVAEAVETGIDVFRIFDALNDVEGMRAAIEATLETPAIAEGTLCYTGDLSDPRERLYTLDYYLKLAEQLVDAGVHVLAIKDMAGLLRAPAARQLVTALRREFDLPVHLHTHDTAGGQLATYIAAIEAGVDAVDGAAAPMAGMTSQPSLAAIVGATATTERDTGLSLDALLALEPYWEAVRSMYGAFETGLKAPTGRVYRHEMPGGQISNLRQQADAVGLRGRFEEVEAAYERANALLGNIVKVTPSSKVVGDLALFAVSAGIDFDELEARPASFDLPDSVIDFLRGGLGVPPAGFPQPFTDRALEGRAPAPAPLEVEGELAERLAQPGAERRAALAEVLFPGPAREFAAAQAEWGDVSLIPTPEFFRGLREDEELAIELGPGVTLLYELEAIGEADARGMRTVLVRVNGQMRPVEVRDRSVDAAGEQIERADPTQPGQVPAPVTGIVTVLVEPGQQVAEGDPVATLEAMKMESTITAPLSGTVERLAAASGRRLEQGDLLLVLAPA